MTKYSETRVAHPVVVSDRSYKCYDQDRMVLYFPPNNIMILTFTGTYIVLNVAYLYV